MQAERWEREREGEGARGGDIRETERKKWSTQLRCSNGSFPQIKVGDELNVSRRALLGQAVKRKTQEEKFTFILCPREDDRGKVHTRLLFNARIYFLAELETIQSKFIWQPVSQSDYLRYPSTTVRDGENQFVTYQKRNKKVKAPSPLGSFNYRLRPALM